MLQHLLDNLNDSNETVHREAVRLAHDLDATELLHLLEMESLRSRRARRSEFGTPAASFALCLLTILGARALPLSGLLSPVVLSCTLFTGSALVNTLWKHRPTPAHVGLASVIADMDDPCFLGPILSILGEPHFADTEDSPWWKPDMEAALKRILPRTGGEHLAELSDTQIAMLLALLAMPYQDPELTVATLNALQHLRAPHLAIPAVTRLAEAPASSPRTLRVHDAATACLRGLTARREQLRCARSLLRPAPAANPEALLRPASVEDNQEQYLVRAHEQDV